MPKLKTHYYREQRLELQEKLQFVLGSCHRITVSKEIPNDIEVLILAYPTEEKLKVSPYLKYLIIPFVGIPDSTKRLMRRYPQIKVLNIHHNSRVVAENIMAFFLAGIKHIIPADKELRKHNWSIRYNHNPASLLYKKKVLICGYGHIGRLLETFLRPYGVKIDKIKKNNTNPEAGIYSLSALNRIVGEYDFVINILPATFETKDVFNHLTFQAMKPNCYFVNVGRASTVEEKALFNALSEKKISGAALDVWYNYPVSEGERTNTNPANYPFNTLDNVIMSPHRAGGLGMEENEVFRIEELTKLLKKIVENPGLEGIDLNIGY